MQFLFYAIGKVIDLFEDIRTGPICLFKFVIWRDGFWMGELMINLGFYVSHNSLSNGQISCFVFGLGISICRMRIDVAIHFISDHLITILDFVADILECLKTLFARRDI